MSSTYSAASADSPSASSEPECEPSRSASRTPSAPPFSENGGPESQFTLMLEPSRQSEESTSSAVASRVSPGHMPGSKWARRMTATSGRQCLKSSDASGPLGCLERMLLDSSTWGSTRSFLTWKKTHTPAGRLIFRLALSMPRTSVAASGSWLATPTETNNQNCPSMQKWPGCARLTEMLPAPTARDYKDGTSVQNVPENGLLGRVYANATGQSLTPGFTEWMMGYPPGWTDCGRLATASSRKSSSGSGFR
jgi:hypothetical protein